MSYDSIVQDIKLTSVSLQSWTGSAWADWLGTAGSPGKDFTPSEFSFSGLGGGDYRLAVAGKVDFQIDFSDPLKPASYQGTVRSIAAPAPEPGALGMALLGLLGVSFAALRRKRQLRFPERLRRDGTERASARSSVPVELFAGVRFSHCWRHR